MKRRCRNYCRVPTASPPRLPPPRGRQTWQNCGCFIPALTVSRPPYLTALALWPMGGTWGGHMVFLDNHTVRLSTSSPSYGAPHHPDHPPGPLRVLGFGALKKDDPWYEAGPSWRSGWQGILAPTEPDRYSPLYAAWRKMSGGLTLEREAKRSAPLGGTQYEEYLPRPSRRRSLYTLYRPDGKAAALFEAHWADWDQQGRLVATVGGRVLAGRLTKHNKLQWHPRIRLNAKRTPGSHGGACGGPTMVASGRSCMLAESTLFNANAAGNRRKLGLPPPAIKRSRSL